MSYTNFTVVMSVYHADCPIFFTEAVNSVLNQTFKPKEIIIVADGPVGDEIDTVINEILKNNIIRVIKLDENKGVGFARRLAVSESSHELVAVMDSDDICVPDRFESQIKEFHDGQTDVLGGWIEEFMINPGDHGLIRRTPTKYKDIYKLGKWRNPINHVTLMFKKSSYDKVGGYRELLANEDWELVARMLSHGLLVRSLPKVLVHARVGNGLVKRRRSSRQFWGEIKSFKLMYQSDYIDLLRTVVNIILRFVIRALPVSFTSYLYNNVLRKKVN